MELQQLVKIYLFKNNFHGATGHPCAGILGRFER